jgi:GT2 family glycosyltransferase
MIGNTVDILGHEKSYYKSVELEQFDDTTLFKIISLKKVLAYLRHLFQIHKKVQLPPIFRIPASVGGATCIPFALVEKAQLPDSTLVEFGEDTDYAWNLKESGALFFKCLSPVFRKVTKQNDVNKTFSVLSKDRAEEEVYLQTRNSIAISRKHSDQMSAILFVNILLKNTILILLLTKKLPHVFFILKRARTIIRGTVTGYSIKLN